MCMVLLGSISSTVGLKGWLKTVVYLSDLSNFYSYKLYLDRDCSLKVSDYKCIKNLPEGFLLSIKFEDIDDINVAKKFLKRDLYVSNDNILKVVQLAENVFLNSTLLGLPVFSLDEKLLGKVLGICDFGGGDIIDIGLFKIAYENYSLSKSSFLEHKEQILSLINNNKFSSQVMLPFFANLFVKIDNELGYLVIDEKVLVSYL